MPQLSVVKILEGSRTVIRTIFTGDGTGELVNQSLLSPVDLVPPRPLALPSFRINQAWWACSNFDVYLGFSTFQPQMVWNCNQNTVCYADFRNFGGLINYGTTPPDGSNGVLWASTKGLALGSRGSLILELVLLNYP